jgi:hypothetical protein
MTGSLVAIAALGLLAGGAIVLIDSLILRRVRRNDPRRAVRENEDERSS